MEAVSFFKSAPRIPRDAIFALTARYNLDTFARKVNLGQGAYRGNDGQPWILPSVREARRQITSQNLDHEYLPILGLASFRSAASELALGSELYSSVKNRVASSQTISGTGGLHLAGALIKSCSAPRTQVFIPEPTWSNHQLMFSTLGFDCQSFRYYNAKQNGIDMQSYISTLESAKPGSIVILHACAHNPTGCDPSREQWHQIGQIIKDRRLFPLFDAAYLGFNSGNVDEDAYAIRYFVKNLGLEVAVSMSFAKNMGLYGERVGCTFFVTQTDSIALNCESVMERLQRSEISNPPAFGAKIASQILNDHKLRQMWFDDLITMSSRIKAMRHALYSLLVENGTPGTWNHIIEQSGMFGFLGLRHDIVIKLKEQYHIYMADNSRISIAGLNESNVAYVAESITECLKADQSERKSGQISSML